tara:strand:- start:5331 stop:6611 length:1281 start_codon:yes stop_codon:yes gene_type:complete
MIKEILGNLYPFITQKEALFTIIYSILFWCTIGLTSFTILLILPFVVIFGMLYFYYYNLSYKDFPEKKEIQLLEDKIILSSCPNLNYSHHNEEFDICINNDSCYKTNLHYLHIPCTEKKAPIIVLIHGTASSATCFREIFKYLNNFYTIYALDLPGFGRSTAENPGNLRGETGVIYYITLMKEFFKRKKLKNIILLGHSWGAYLISYYSFHYTEHVKQLMILEPPGLLPVFGKYGAYWAFAFKYKVMHLPGLLGQIGLMCAQSFFHMFNYGDDVLYQYIINNNKNNWGPDIVADQINYKWTGGNWKNCIIQKLIYTTVPFTVLYGENDSIIPKEQKLLLDKLYPESCIILKGCCHSPHTENPKELCLNIFKSYKKMKNRRKHIKMDPKKIQDYLVDIKHLDNFKTSFDPEYTQRITDILFNKHYLL